MKLHVKNYLENRASESEHLQKELNYVPYTIFIG